MAFIQLDDISAKLEISVFAEAVEANRSRLREDQVLVIEGKVSNDDFNGGLRIIADKIYELGEARSLYARSLLVQMSSDTADATRFAGILTPYRSEEAGCPVRIAYRSPQASAELMLPKHWGVRLDDGLLGSLKEWLGDQAVKVIW
jgi:DNA polymerase-3 subunit alpha